MSSHILLLYLCIYYLGVQSTALPRAISIAPDQFFDGIDGQWSTFQITVGTPGQTLRLLPGTSASPMSSSWVIDSTGCSALGPVLPNPLPPRCPQSRGGLFTSNSSTTYSTERLQNKGNGTIYSIDTVVETYPSEPYNAYFGFDSISLGIPGSGLPTVKDQVIASLVIPNFWLGFLGLSPWPTNFTSFLDPQPSLLSTLAEDNLIPSKSWSYTAGAWYRDPPSFGSLTIGGYDTTRFFANNVTFAFGADLSRDLLVSVNSITSNLLGQQPLLAYSIGMFIDSLIPEIWLPTSVCHQFENQFQLKYDNTTQRYIVDEETHKSLLSTNPSFLFNLGQAGASKIEPGNTVNIELPYAAFDMNVTSPIVNGSARYFPLRRATNEMQYILGRVFLQEAYIIADYERRNFSVSQATFPTTRVPQHIVDIFSPSKDNGTDSNGQSESQKSKGSALSHGAVAGITIGCLAAVALIVLSLFYLRRARSRREEAVHTELHGHDIQEKDGRGADELDTKEAVVAELNEDTCRHELHANRDTIELPVSPAVAAELEANNR